jgi:predicted transposase/invertase (TIGR01784 family)
LNVNATELSALDQKLQAFYHYLQKGVVESDLTQTISDSITILKNNSNERRFYMTWAVKMADARYDGYEEGFEEGREDGLKVGIEQGIEQGREQGAYQNKLETAKAFLAYGDSPEKVAICTNLPLDVVQNLTT